MPSRREMSPLLFISSFPDLAPPMQGASRRCLPPATATARYQLGLRRFCNHNFEAFSRCSLGEDSRLEDPPSASETAVKYTIELRKIVVEVSFNVGPWKSKGGRNEMKVDESKCRRRDAPHKASTALDRPTGAYEAWIRDSDTVSKWRTEDQANRSQF